MTKTENNILLFSITLCWAASYIFIKNLPEDFSSYAYLTITTGIAAVLMTAIFFRQLSKITRSTLVKGFLLSFLLSVNLLVEKKGISMLQPATASFLAALSIIIVPVLLILLRQKPTRNQMLGTVIILAGLCVSTGFSPGELLNAGAAYMIGGCICSAVYTVAADRYTKEEDPLLICMVQMCFTALIGFFLWLREEPETFMSVTYTRELLSNLFILAFFAKAYAYVVLMFSQKYADAVSVTVIASTEPVVTLALSVLLPAAYGGTRGVTLSSVAGAMVIALGAVTAGLSFMDRKNSRTGEKGYGEYEAK